MIKVRDGKVEIDNEGNIIVHVDKQIERVSYDNESEGRVDVVIKPKAQACDPED